MTASVLSHWISFLRPMYEFIYPPTCFACEHYLNREKNNICSTCLASIRPITPEDGLYREKLSELRSRGNVSGLASAFHFEKDGTLQTLIHHLKYDDMPGIGVELGMFVGTTLRSMLGDAAIGGLVPVPLHPAKERERGYNQSEFICKGISKVTGLKVFSHVLRRTRHTQTQTRLNAQERKENVADAFALDSRYARLVNGATFLIVDDIITTGATIDECARVLKENGAERVLAASVAVPDHAHVP